MNEAIARRRLRAATAPARSAASAPSAGDPGAAPLVAVLCSQSRARAFAAGVALALARAAGRPCALVGVVGASDATALGGMPAARRAAGALQRRGLPASASGRLVWLADRRGPLDAADGAAPSRAAALSAELGRSAAAAGLPAAVVFPFARTDALDRVLAWHDAIVVVREPDAPAGVLDRALASLAALGRPAAAMVPSARLPGLLAVAGLAAPAEAASAVAALELGGGPSGRRRG